MYMPEKYSHNTNCSPAQRHMAHEEFTTSEMILATCYQMFIAMFVYEVLKANSRHYGQHFNNLFHCRGQCQLHVQCL